MSAKELEASALATHNLAGCPAWFSIKLYMLMRLVAFVISLDVDKLLVMARTLTTPQAGKSKSNRVVCSLKRMLYTLFTTNPGSMCFNCRMRLGWLLCTRCGACL